MVGAHVAAQPGKTLHRNPLVRQALVAIAVVELVEVDIAVEVVVPAAASAGAGFVVRSSGSVAVVGALVFEEAAGIVDTAALAEVVGDTSPD